LEVVPDLPNYVGRGAVNNFPITGGQRYHITAENATKVFLSSLIWHLFSGFQFTTVHYSAPLHLPPLGFHPKEVKNTRKTASMEYFGCSWFGVCGVANLGLVSLRG
jgi:hypothetical protein